MFSHIVFFKPSNEDEILIESIQNFFNKVFNKNEPTTNFDIINTESQLNSKFSLEGEYSSYLLVSFIVLSSHQFKYLYHKGLSFFLMWEDFLLCFQVLFINLKVKQRKSSYVNSVGLLFLPGYFQTILSGIFRIYGLNPQFINSMNALEKIKPEELCHIVLDQDLISLKVSPKQIRNYREKIITYIKRILNDNHSISVFVVKNFDQGSLFDDIISSVKDICNLLLSHEEYLLFIKRFLYESHTQIILKKLNTLQKKMQLSYFQKNSWQCLKNPKKIYQELMGLTDMSHAKPINSTNHSNFANEISINHEKLNLILNCQVKHKLFEWIDHYLLNPDSEDRKNRASFEFMTNTKSEPEKDL